MNYKYMEDHMFVIYDTVSMGNWFFTFQGNEDVSSSVVDLRRFDQNRKWEHSTFYMATKTWKFTPEYASLNASMEVSKDLEMIWKEAAVAYCKVLPWHLHSQQWNDKIRLFGQWEFVHLLHTHQKHYCLKDAPGFMQLPVGLPSQT